MIRLILWLLLIYLAYRMVKNWLEGPVNKTQVKGKPKTSPLDLHDADIEDANFREIREESRQQPKA